MKILYLTNGHPPTHTAGTETYTAGIAAELARQGHDVRVICGGEWESGPEPFNGVATDHYNGVTVTRLNLNWTRGPDPNRSLYDNSLTEAFVKTALADFRPDVVHITSCYTLSASILRAVKSGGYPLIVTLTDFWFICPRVSLLRSDGVRCDGRTSALTCLKCSMADSHLYQSVLRAIPDYMVEPLLIAVSHRPVLSRRRGFRGLSLDMQQRKTILPSLLKMADVLIAPSRFLAAIYQANGIGAPIRVVPYGHNLNWVSEVKRPAAATNVVFGYVGRITYSKGVHLFTEALARLGSNQPVEGRIWGDTDQQPEYSERLRNTSPPSAAVEFRGSFARAQIAEVYSQIDVLVVPSIWYENNPLVIQEAFAAGVPVIAANLGGMAEFVQHQHNGLLFRAGDSDELAQAMRQFVDDSTLLDRLRSGISPVQTVQAEAETLLGLFRQTISGERVLPWD